MEFLPPLLAWLILGNQIENEDRQTNVGIIFGEKATQYQLCFT